MCGLFYVGRHSAHGASTPAAAEIPLHARALIWPCLNGLIRVWVDGEFNWPFTGHLTREAAIGSWAGARPGGWQSHRIQRRNRSAVRWRSPRRPLLVACHRMRKAMSSRHWRNQCDCQRRYRAIPGRRITIHRAPALTLSPIQWVAPRASRPTPNARDCAGA